MKKSKTKGAARKTTNKMKARAAKGKSKGQAPAALRKKKRSPRAVAPAPREVGLLDAIGEAMSEIESLAEEMRSWADNMPESKQGGDKHSEVEECADTLENQAMADPVEPIMSKLNDVKITIQDPTPRRRGYSRDARLGQARSIIGDVLTKLEEHPWAVEEKEHADTLHNGLDEIEGELDGVSFPGMFG